MSRTLAIIGSGGHGSVVAEAAELAGHWDTIVFFDDHAPLGETEHGWKVIGTMEDLMNKTEDSPDCVVAIGDNATRLSLTMRMEQQGLNLVSVVHPAATVSRYSSIAPGSVVFAGAVINIGSKLGKACIVNNAATVNHDCVISPGVHIGPNVGLGGNVSVGQESWIGIGASVKHGVQIGSNAVVGAGAAVISDVDDNHTVAGVPSKKIRKVN